MRKRNICAGLFLTAMLLTACGAAAGEETAKGIQQDVQEEQTAVPSEPESEDTAPMTVSEIYQDIVDHVELVSPVEMDGETISSYYGIEPETLEDYIFVVSEDATSAETVVIMKVKDTEKIEDIKSALELVIDEKRAEMENYLPEQFQIVDESAVESKDDYVWLVISEKRADILARIKQDI